MGHDTRMSELELETCTTCWDIISSVWRYNGDSGCHGMTKYQDIKWSHWSLIPPTKSYINIALRSHDKEVQVGMKLHLSGDRMGVLDITGRYDYSPSLATQQQVPWFHVAILKTSPRPRDWNLRVAVKMVISQDLSRKNMNRLDLHVTNLKLSRKSMHISW